MAGGDAAAGEAGVPRSWPRYVATWAKADIAIASPCFRRVYALGVAGRSLQATSFDGLRPHTVIDERSNDLSHFPEPERSKKAKQAAERGGFARALAAVPQPAASVRVLACALAGGGEEAEGQESLLVLLSNGLLLAIDPVYLCIEAVLGAFPEVREDGTAGPALAVLRELGLAVVAEGARLGLVQVEAGPPESAGGVRDIRALALPKGCVANFVLTYPGRDCLLIAGCGNGRLLIYRGLERVSSSRASPLLLSQALDITGAPATVPMGDSLAGIASNVRDFFRRGKSRSPGRSKSPGRPATPPTPPPPAGGGAGARPGSATATDAFALLGGGEADNAGLLAAAGHLTSGGSGGLITVWHVSIDSSWRDQPGSPSRAGPACTCTQIAQAVCGAPVYRVMLLAATRSGGTSTVLLSLDSNADITVWSVRGEQLVMVNSIPGRCTYEANAARTFGLAGSLYLLVAMGSRGAGQVGWLDAVALLEGCGRCGRHLAPPLAGRGRTCLGPPLVGSTAPGVAAELASGGEVFFLSESALRCYHATTGRTSNVNVLAPAGSGVEDWRALAILDVFGPARELAPTHLLIAVAEAGGDSGGQAGRAVWLVSTVGECIGRAQAAFDAAFVGRAPGEMQIVWLTVGDDGVTMAHVAQAFGSAGVLQASASAPAAGVERVIGGPACDPKCVIYWGSWLGGGPLRLSSRLQPGGAGLAPQRGPAVHLPAAWPAELVDARWDGRGEEGPCCLALASAHALWAVSFAPGSQGQAPRAELLAWLDLRAAMLGAGRALSLAWLRPEAPAGAAGAHGALLASTPSGVVVWAVRSGRPPRNVALCERPQLLAGALLDRLLCVEVQTSASALAGPDRHADRSALARGPRARVRTRPVSLFEPVMAAVEGDPPSVVAEALARCREGDWRLAPAELAEGVPGELAAGLWPAACCSEAPPQLCASAAAFRRAAAAAGDQFRGLAAAVCGLQTGGPRRSRSSSGGSGAAEEARAAAQVEETVLGLRLGPGGLDMLHCAAGLLVDCMSQAAPEEPCSGLAIASRGLAKHDLLPCGALAAAVLHAASDEGLARFGVHRLQLPAAGSLPLSPASPQAAGRRWPQRHWSQALCSPAPMVAVLLERAAARGGGRREGRSRTASDFSAAALLQQPYADPPPLRRPAQVARATGHSACQLHTATFLQWLGLGSTQMQVRVFQAIQNEAGDSSPATGTGASPSAGGRPGGAGPPAVLPGGLLVYWRCADGEGLAARDSAGCGRSGLLGEACQWRGPLPPDDPLEASDEWGQPLAPNFAVLLGAGELRYSPADGAAGAEDRQLLALVGGAAAARAAGERLLEEAQRADDRGEDAAAPERGWTVEIWARLGAGASGELSLFSRPGLAWSYQCSPPAFAVRSSPSASAQLSSPTEGLPTDEWVHLALRSNLRELDVWAGQQVVARSAPGAELPPVPDEAGLCFGPGQGLEVTELRVWGARRSDLELADQQRQPLPSLLQAERRGDAWRKVRIRPGGMPAAPAEGVTGLWDLTKLAVPEVRTSRQQGGPAAAAAPEAAFVPSPSGQSSAPPSIPAPAWGEWQDPWGDMSAPKHSTAASAWGSPLSQAAAPAPAAPSPPPAPAKPKLPAPEPAEVPPSRRERAEAAQGPAAARGPAAPPAVARWDAGSAAKAAAPRPTLPIPSLASQPPARRPLPPPEAPQPAPQPARRPSPPQAEARPQTSGPPSAPPAERPKGPIAPALDLGDVLPAPARCEAETMEAVDASLRVAARALERGSHALAAAAFRASLGRLAQRLPAGSAAGASQAVRARCEAAAAYGALCGLLQEIEELRPASAGGAAEASQRLCTRWACVLRLPKAPRHTVFFAVKAMAAFYSGGRHVGGWPAAREVASMLLDRCSTMLSEEQLRQAHFVREAATHGRVAFGAAGPEAGACGSCPRCGQGLGALAASCGACGTEVAFCFRERKVCDAHVAAFCTLCGAAVGGAGRQSVLQRARGAGDRVARRPGQSVKAEICFVCGAGELRPRRWDGVDLTY